METTIYRTGQMSVPSHGEDIFLHWAEFDMRRPAGHVSRINALFAAPDLQGAHEWLIYRAVRTAITDSKALAFNEITVESDNVLVYCIEDYDLVGPHYGNPSREQIAHIDNYWNNSMTLTQWIREVGEDPHGRWEVLLPENEIIKSRTLTYNELWEMYEGWGMDDERTEELETHVRAKLKSDIETPVLSL